MGKLDTQEETVFAAMHLISQNQQPCLPQIV
jgi:hypothetical protein